MNPREKIADIIMRLANDLTRTVNSDQPALVKEHNLKDTATKRFETGSSATRRDIAKELMKVLDDKSVNDNLYSVVATSTLNDGNIDTALKNLKKIEDALQTARNKYSKVPKDKSSLYKALGEIEKLIADAKTKIDNVKTLTTTVASASLKKAEVEAKDMKKTSAAGISLFFPAISASDAKVAVSAHDMKTVGTLPIPPGNTTDAKQEKTSNAFLLLLLVDKHMNEINTKLQGLLKSYIGDFIDHRQFFGGPIPLNDEHSNRRLLAEEVRKKINQSQQDFLSLREGNLDSEKIYQIISNLKSDINSYAYVFDAHEDFGVKKHLTFYNDADFPLKKELCDPFMKRVLGHSDNLKDIFTEAYRVINNTLIALAPILESTRAVLKAGGVKKEEVQPPAPSQQNKR